MLSPEWRLNPGFDTQKECPFHLNKGVPSIEVIDTKVIWVFFWDQSLCPLNRGVPKVPDHISTSKAVWLHVQSNLSVMATLGTEESGHCKEVAVVESWPLAGVRL